MVVVGGREDTPYNSLFRNSQPARGMTIFFRLQAYYKTVGISQVEVHVYERLGKSAI